MVAKRCIDISRVRELAFIGMNFYFFLIRGTSENFKNLPRPFFRPRYVHLFEFLNIHLVT
jgi:hypothetical protein